MNKEYVEIDCPNVGHGNFGAAVSLKKLLQDAGHITALHGLPISSWPAAQFQKIIARNGHRVEQYNDHSEMLREGILGQAFAFLARVELKEKRVAREILGASEGIGIYCQELLLSRYSKDQLQRIHPDGYFLVVPDVFPKPSAIKVMKETGVVPIVWNKEAYEYLQTEGLNPILSAPFLPDGFINENESINGQGRHILVKSAGGGIPEKYINLINTQSEETNSELIFYDKNSRKQYFRGIRRESDIRFHNGQATLSDFYQSLVNNPPEIVIGFPSEMVQVVTWLYLRGWKGKFIALPPKGVHETVNLKWALANGVCQGVLDFSTGPEAYGDRVIKIVNLNEVIVLPTTFPIDLVGKVGQTPVVEAIESAVNEKQQRGAERVAISSACYVSRKIEPVFSHNIPAYVRQEAVVHSVGDLDTIKSSREVAGVHYKPKTLADMANGLSALVNDYRLKGKYVSFHVDDLYRALRSQETLSPYLEKLVIEAGKNDVNILIENSTARTDGYVPPETYNLQSMVKTFGALMEKHDNFGFCVDLSHLMEDDFKGFDLIVTAYDFNRNSPELSEVMFSNGEREKYEDIIFAINHAKTIHFSRAHEGKVTDGALIKLAAKLRVPHQRVAQLYNLLNAHLTGSSDPKFWEVVTGLLTNLGFKGVYVVESFASRQPLSFINDVHGLINA